MILKSDTIKISNCYSSVITQLLSAFNPEDLKPRHSSIRNEVVRDTVSKILYQLERDIETLPLCEFLIEETENLKNTINIQVIHKNKNRPYDRSIKEALQSNYTILENRIDEMVSSLTEKLSNSNEDKRKKFDDVKVSRSELALFILLAEKYGLISRNNVSESDQAKAFTILTNYSTDTLRRNISDTYLLEPFTLPLDQDKLANLKSILDNIGQEIAQKLEN